MARVASPKTFGTLCRLLALVPVLAWAPALDAGPAMVAREMVAGLTRPLEVVPAGDGANRLFVLEQAGRVRIVEGRTLLPGPFLDLSASISSGGERGLLGLAFHPDYAVNRAFYVFYTALNGDLTVARYLRDPTDPRRADPQSGAVLLSIPHSQFANHNGGKLAFGPDGYLYIGTGDGGSGGDPGNNSQNVSSLLGKLLRIAVDAGDQYRIPPDNPFAPNAKCPAGLGPCPEIWAYGLRNPWKFSFDRVNGDLFIGDVGQNLWEEVDYRRAGSPGAANFGWRVFEGTHCFNPPVGCILSGHVPPILEYPHDATGGFSVTGGYRYRGLRNSSLRGHYVYGDFVSRRIWSAFPSASGAWTPTVMLNPPTPFGGISSFAEDHAGELLFADLPNGKLWALEPPLALSSLYLAFPRTPVGGSAVPRAVSLTNAALAAFSITAVSASGDFSVAGNACTTLLRGAACVVRIGFSPSASGARTGELVIRTDFPGNPVFRVPLAGNRVAGPSADFDGNGREDILWRSASGAMIEWLLAGRADPGSAVKLPSVLGRWVVAGTGDFDGDGIADLLWRNLVTGANTIWLLRPGGIKGGAVVTAEPDVGWRVAGIGDFNGDGGADIAWRHAVNGQNRIWFMSGIAVAQALDLAAVPDPQWSIVATGDLDGDGRSDLVWRHGTSGENLAWLMDGSGVIEGGALRGEPSANWRILRGADFDGDGRADLAWRNLATGANRLWLMNGTTIASEGAVQAVGLGWTLAGAGDYDGDGKADLLWTNPATGVNIVWFMNGATRITAKLLPLRPAGMAPLP